MLLKIEIVLYRCFRRVLISILCLVMHVSCAYVLRQLSVFLGQGWAFCGEDSFATLRGSSRSVRYCE